MIIAPCAATPTGLGISFDGESFRVIGPCCDKQLFYAGGSGNESVECMGCNKIYPNVEGDARATSAYYDSPDNFLKSWVAHWTGWKCSELKIEILK